MVLVARDPCSRVVRRVVEVSEVFDDDWCAGISYEHARPSNAVARRARVAL
jgi:hypothetical protein